MIRQYWQKLSQRLDAMNLRERGLVFAAVALALIFLLNELMLEPLFVQQKRMAQQLSQDQAKSAEVQREIQQKISANAQDPDKLNQQKLLQMREQIQTLRTELLGVQKNLVSPEKMPQLLEDLLRRNGRLKLVSLKTLPPQNLNASEKKDAEGGPTKVQPGSKPEVAAEAGAIYRHGVEIVVQGRYPDMVDYLTALEGLKWDLYWGKAKLQVDEYPVANLTLTVYTLSLDKAWLNL